MFDWKEAGVYGLGTADNTKDGVGASECCVGELSGDPLDKDDRSEPEECID